MSSTRVRNGRAAGVLVALAGLVVFGAAAPADADAPCVGRSAIRTGDHDRTIQVGAQARTYRVHVPAGYSPDRRTPAVLVFHGGLGTGRIIQQQSRMDQVADAEGFLSVYPDGLHKTWNAGLCCEGAMERKVDDVGFVSALLDRLDADYCVDKARVYATGLSNGSMMSHRLACELSDRIAAIGAVSGVVMVTSCAPTRPVPVIVFHGTADPRSLWEGGLGAKDPRKGTRASIPETMRTLAERNQCPATTRTTYQRGDATCSAQGPCAEGSEVVLCRIEGGGHQWPGGQPIWPRELGHTSRDISASQVMWQFFKQHPIQPR